MSNEVPQISVHPSPVNVAYDPPNGLITEAKNSIWDYQEFTSSCDESISTTPVSHLVSPIDTGFASQSTGCAIPWQLSEL